MDNEQIFETVINSNIFLKYESLLSENDYNDLLNEITYFVDSNSSDYMGGKFFLQR
jgi:hypothetical protein